MEGLEEEKGDEDADTEMEDDATLEDITCAQLPSEEMCVCVRLSLSLSLICMINLYCVSRIRQQLLAGEIQQAAVNSLSITQLRRLYMCVTRNNSIASEDIDDHSGSCVSLTSSMHTELDSTATTQKRGACVSIVEDSRMDKECHNIIATLRSHHVIDGHATTTKDTQVSVPRSRGRTLGVRRMRNCNRRLSSPIAAVQFNPAAMGPSIHVCFKVSFVHLDRNSLF